MKRRNMRVQGGDTVIEVIMSLVILGAVVVGAVTLMSSGIKLAQMAVEHTETRLEVNRQLELLRYLRGQYMVNENSDEADVWRQVVDASSDSPLVYDTPDCGPTPDKKNNTFYLTDVEGSVKAVIFDPNDITPNIKFKAASSNATAGDGLWVEIRKSSGITPAFVDVAVRACWASLSGGADQRTVTAERLYDPYR